jgi:hypothetical protein
MIRNTQALVLPINAKRELIIKSIKNLSYFTYFMRNITKSYVKYPFFLKGNPNEDEGASFIQIYDEYIKVYSKIKSMIETDYFIRIVYQAYKTIPTSFEFEYIITIFFRGIDNCLLISNFRYSKKISLPRPSLFDERQKRMKIFLNIQKQLFEGELDKFNIEEISINAPFKLVFDIFINFKVVHKYIKFFGDIIEYNGNVINEKMIIKITQNNNLSSNIIIENIQKKEKECFIKCIKEYDKSEKKENEKIIFLIYGEEQKTMFYMMNFYNYILPEDNVKKLSIQKKNMLCKLKKIIENYFESQKKN